MSEPDAAPSPLPIPGATYVPQRPGSDQYPRIVIGTVTDSHGTVVEVMYPPLPGSAVSAPVVMGCHTLDNWNAWVRRHDARPVQP